MDSTLTPGFCCWSYLMYPLWIWTVSKNCLAHFTFKLVWRRIFVRILSWRSTRHVKNKYSTLSFRTTTMAWHHSCGLCSNYSLIASFSAHKTCTKEKRMSSNTMQHLNFCMFPTCKYIEAKTHQFCLTATAPGRITKPRKPMRTKRLGSSMAFSSW